MKFLLLFLAALNLLAACHHILTSSHPLSSKTLSACIFSAIYGILTPLLLCKRRSPK